MTDQVSRAVEGPLDATVVPLQPERTDTQRLAAILLATPEALQELLQFRKARISTACTRRTTGPARWNSASGAPAGRASWGRRSRGPPPP